MLSSKYLNLFEMFGDNVDTMPIPKTKKNDADSYIEDLLSEGKKRHIRVIGYAGTGKSTYINNNYSCHEYILTSYTRIAAVQINGNTLSSIFQLGRLNENSVVAAISAMRYFTPRILINIQIVKGIVIDEFYTAPAAIIEKVNLICQAVRECNEPFGGLQLILVGDVRQTQSVDSAFVDSDLYKSLVFEEIILPEHPLMRLTSEYMAFCNIFRNPKLNRDKMLRLLKDKRFAQEEVKDAYTVYYTNKEVNKRNADGMCNFNGDVIYEYMKTGYKKNCPIYIKNNTGPFCNGMMGFLRKRIGKNLVIEVDGQEHEVKSSQIDFVPGFATTIHRCQSKTWAGVNIYIRKTDVFLNRSLYIRLLYVALTRVRHFDRCYISLY